MRELNKSNIVFFREVCPVCKALLGFEVDPETLEVSLARETPFVRACRRVEEERGIGTVALCVSSEVNKKFLVSMVRAYYIEVPCLIGPFVGFWRGPIHPFLREEVYTDILLGRRKPITFHDSVPKEFLLTPEEITEVLGLELEGRAEGA